VTRSFQPAGVAAAVTLGVAALLVTGCSAGQTAQTATQKSTVDGTAGTAGDIALRYVRLAYPEGGQYLAGATATLQFFAVNSGPQPDRLVQVRTDGAAQVTMSPAGTGTASASATPPGTPSGTPSGSVTGGAATTTPTGSQPATATGSAAPAAQAPVPIPPHGLVAFDEGRTEGAATVQLVGLTQDLLSGQTVPVTFSFARGGMVTLDVPIATSLAPLPKPAAVLSSTAAP
jgi:copper(I)-binding protein